MKTAKEMHLTQPLKELILIHQQLLRIEGQIQTYSENNTELECLSKLLEAMLEAQDKLNTRILSDEFWDV
ncbi:MAG: hypothetical protein Crog4KO_30790 [Crocinitomicaceae bacterium]